MTVLQSKHIDIIANDAKISADGSAWTPIWRHDTPLGHDKAASIQEYRTIASSESEDGSCPLVVFVGDGVSDLAAAREADVLFARRGLRLEEYCQENKIPHIPFDTFKDIQNEIVKILKEDSKKTQAKGKPVQYNPRANFWRKAIKKKNVSFPSTSRNECELTEYCRFLASSRTPRKKRRLPCGRRRSRLPQRTHRLLFRNRSAMRLRR